MTKNIPDYGLVMGNPARLKGFACKCGNKLESIIEKSKSVYTLGCECGIKVDIPSAVYNAVE